MVKSLKNLEAKVQLPLMRIIKGCNNEEKKYLINHLSPQGLNDYCEIVYNGLYSNFNIGKAKRKQLRSKLLPIAKDLRYIANVKNPIELRKKRLLKKQTGTGVSLLVSALGKFCNNMSNYDT